MLHRFGNRHPIDARELHLVNGAAQVSVTSTLPSTVVAWSKRALSLSETLLLCSDGVVKEAMAAARRLGAGGLMKGALQSHVDALSQHRSEYNALTSMTPSEDAIDTATDPDDGAIVESDQSVHGKWRLVGSGCDASHAGHHEGAAMHAAICRRRHGL
jgi:hypothetical protein